MTNSNPCIILLVSNDLFCDNRVHKMAMTLYSQGVDVLVVGRRLSESLELPSVPYKQKRLKFFFKKGPLFYAEMNLRFFFFLLFQQFDIVTANDLDTLVGAYCASKVKKKELVYDCHEFFTEVPELVDRPAVRRIWEKIETLIFPKLRSCMTVCDSIAETYRRKYNVDMEVVRNLPLRLVSREKATIKIPSENIVFYQGVLNIGRGLELLIEAMNFVENACLLIVGDGDIKSELVELVKNKKMAGKVFIVGKKSFSELRGYTNLATIGVSLEEDRGLNYRYALPNKLFDYIQAEKPVLVSNLPEMLSIVEKYQCGEIVTNRTPELLGNQISQMLNDTEKLKKYAENSRIAATELCWENEQHRVLRLYDKLLHLRKSM